MKEYCLPVRGVEGAYLDFGSPLTPEATLDDLPLARLITFATRGINRTLSTYKNRMSSFMTMSLIEISSIS